jgi:hypothetical protein
MIDAQRIGEHDAHMDARGPEEREADPDGGTRLTRTEISQPGKSNSDRATRRDLGIALLTLIVGVILFGVGLPGSGGQKPNPVSGIVLFLGIVTVFAGIMLAIEAVRRSNQREREAARQAAKTYLGSERVKGGGGWRYNPWGPRGFFILGGFLAALGLLVVAYSLRLIPGTNPADPIPVLELLILLGAGAVLIGLGWWWRRWLRLHPWHAARWVTGRLASAKVPGPEKGNEEKHGEGPGPLW